LQQSPHSCAPRLAVVRRPPQRAEVVQEGIKVSTMETYSSESDAIEPYGSRFKSKPKIVVLGGGFGGLETALNLRRSMPERAEIILVSDEDHFLYKPNAIYIPFGLDPGRLRVGLAHMVKRRNIKFVHARALEIDPISKYVGLDSYSYEYKLNYDYLVVATGAKVLTNAVPGLEEFAHPIWTPDDMLRLRARFQQLVAEAKEGRCQSALFVVPPQNEHVGPIYEMALMLDTWLRRKKVREQVEVTLTTSEGSYVEAFGPKMHETVSREFQARGIRGYNHYEVTGIESGESIYRNGVHLPFDLLVTFPPCSASTRFTSLPVDERGFIATQLESGQVVGFPDIYAVGDAADFPVKQAYIAAKQGDAAADHLAAQILGKAPQVDFEPSSIFLMEGLDRATYAQAPMRLTGRREDPSEVKSDHEDEYRVGSSRMWRLGKLALGIYLPMRFKAGNPFHVGAPWKGIEAGVKLMSGLTTR